MSEFKVFYSWQSDLPNATNRGFIQDALEKACKQVANDPDIEEAPRVDQDTKDLSGSPLIPAAILEKIDECQAFVADVSLCFSGPGSKVAPNPNVVYELGYAIARLGWDRVILVVNEEYGKVETLPFDLEKRRAIPYTAKVGEQNRSEAKKALVVRLTANIEAIAKRQPIVPRRTPADIAIESIENKSPARRARVRDFWAWVMAELKRLEPDLKSMVPVGSDATEIVTALKEAISNTGDLLRSWSLVCDAIALAGDDETADIFARGFGDVYAEYDHKAGWSGGSYEYWFDFWRFIGHELYTVWIASLLKERRWSLIDSSLSQEYYQESARLMRPYTKLSDHVRLLLADSEKSRRVSMHADILAARYGQGGIGSTISDLEFMNGDIFLYLAGESRVPSSYGFCAWRPWSVLNLEQPPPFLRDARSHRIANEVNQVLRQADSAATRKLLTEAGPQIGKLWGHRNPFWDTPITGDVILAYDSIP